MKGTLLILTSTQTFVSSWNLICQNCPDSNSQILHGETSSQSIYRTDMNPKFAQFILAILDF